MLSSSSTPPQIPHPVRIVISLLGLGICGFCICPWTGQIIMGIFFGALMASGESVVHTAISPDNQITALVISDGCGITCGCTVRIDLKTENQYMEEIWRGVDVCDATVTWLSATEFEILANNRQQIRFNIRTLGLSP